MELFFDSSLTFTDVIISIIPIIFMLFIWKINKKA